MAGRSLIHPSSLVLTVDAVNEVHRVGAADEPDQGDAIAEPDGQAVAAYARDHHAAKSHGQTNPKVGWTCSGLQTSPIIVLSPRPVKCVVLHCPLPGRRVYFSGNVAKWEIGHG